MLSCMHYCRWTTGSLCQGILRAGNRDSCHVLLSANKLLSPSFLPADVDLHALLQVDYREPLSGAGRMPGSRSRTEGSPNDREVDTASLVEKAIMPMFAPGFTGNVTVSNEAQSCILQILYSSLVQLCKHIHTVSCMDTLTL